LISSFHVIGEVFDNVYGEGGTIVSQKNVQTTIIPAGGSAIVEFTVDVPGTFILVDHSIFRAFNKGAIGMLKVSGKDDLVIYSGKQKDDVYLGSNEEPNQDMFAGPINVEQAPESNQTAAGTEEKGMDMSAFGKSIFTTTCAVCHQPNGEGLPNVFPPLAKSDFLNKNKEASINAVINGLSGEITVNGKKYNGIMLPQNLNNKQIAAVLTHVYSQWGNSGKKVTEEEVAKLRGKKNLSAK
ncbi:MAG: c-type cytochrome, partial [Ignavibacteria bacterium]|nr:c-type cytochrome [Ignavibacteria bacterium]